MKNEPGPLPVSPNIPAYPPAVLPSNFTHAMYVESSDKESLAIGVSTCPVPSNDMDFLPSTISSNG